MITRRTNPDIALRFNPNEPVALATKADLLFLKSQDPKTLTRVEALAKQSLRAQALNPTAVRILGYVADARGQKDKARELILLSEKMSRREFGAQLWLIEDAAARNDVKTALKHYDIALRATSESPVILFPTLNDAMALSDVRDGFVPYVRQWPAWMTSYIGQAIEGVANPADVADVLIRGGKMPVDASTRFIPPALLAKLASKGQYRTFRQYYATLPGAKAAALTTVSMNADSVNLRYPVAGWQLTEVPAMGGAFSKAGSGAYTLQAFAGSGERGEIMRKLLILPPGRYAFSAGYAAEVAVPDAEIRWELFCLSGTGQRSVWTKMDRVVAGNSKSGGELLIDGQCPFQALSLQAAGGAGQSGVDFTVRSVSLRRI